MTTTMNPSSSFLCSPRVAPVLRMLGKVWVVLTLYVVVTNFFDPLPYPVREIACGAAIALVLAYVVARWVEWVRAKSAWSSLPREALLTVTILLGSYLFFGMVFSDPLPHTVDSVLVLSFFPLMLALLMWSVAKTRDEVARAAAFEGFAWGALVAMGLMQAAMFALRFSPALSDWMDAMTQAPGPLSQTARGFGMGMTFAMVVVWLCIIFSRALWWIRKR
jgi:hypothetical protein